MEIFGMGGGYRWMDAYLFAWVVELGTDSFCETFLDYKNDPQGKTSGQMNHAARSGNRNFAEGCERLMTSTASGLDLLNVAKASLCELRDDYLKWLLRARQLPWGDTVPEAVAIRRLDLDPPPGRAAGLPVLRELRVRQGPPPPVAPAVPVAPARHPFPTGVSPSICWRSMPSSRRGWIIRTALCGRMRC
jgi:hypothetical protein